MSVNEITVDKASVDEMDKISIFQLFLDKLSFDEMSLDETTVDNMLVGEVSVDEMSWCHKSTFENRLRLLSRFHLKNVNTDEI